MVSIGTHRDADGFSQGYDAAARDDAKEFARLDKRIAELEEVLDHILMLGVERAQGWVMVPKVEWDQAVERAKLRKE